MANPTQPGAGGGAAESGEQFASSSVGTSYIPGNTFGLKQITYSAVDGEAIVEGDIVVGSVAEMEAVKQSVENPGPDGPMAMAVAINGFRWPDGVVVYRIDPALPNQQRVTDAIAHIEANSNLRFRLRGTENDYVTFRPSTGCSSSVGMRGGEQFVNLGVGCSTGNVIHEILHAAGLWHEQSREDRDTFVIIRWDNIAEASRHNFNQHIVDGDDIGAYDYDSIMHYPRNAFAINSAADTITPRPDPNRAIGQRNGMSAGDIAAINAIYPRKATLGETSTNGPALTTRGHDLLLSWTGTGNLQLNFLQSSDGLNFRNKVTLGELSPDSPALTVFNNRYVVAWIGVGNLRLNIMQSSDGVNWTDKVTLGDTSTSAPELAVFNNRLYLTWRGVGNNRLNVISSADGRTWGGKVTLGDTTTSGPTLTTLGGNLLLGWRGVGNNWLNLLRTQDGVHFFGKVILGETTVSRPYLHTTGNRVLYTWQGVGNRFLNYLVSTDGTHWGGKVISRETCIGGPVISSLGRREIWSWTGTDQQHRLNALSFNV